MVNYMMDAVVMLSMRMLTNSKVISSLVLSVLLIYCLIQKKKLDKLILKQILCSDSNGNLGLGKQK